ncbi:MAG: hypothetical protein MZW92_13205 [Comamonadaceae bacterium]|nr:hypothetical protein [Comamonadaceae bacterium]
MLRRPILHPAPGAGRRGGARRLQRAAADARPAPRLAPGRTRPGAGGCARHAGPERACCCAPPSCGTHRRRRCWGACWPTRCGAGGGWKQPRATWTRSWAGSEQEPALSSAAASPGTGADPWQRRIDAVHSAVEARRRSQRFISAALDSLPVGVVVTDASRRVLLANAQAPWTCWERRSPGPVRESDR